MKLKDAAARHMLVVFFVFAEFAAFSFLFGGLAHHALDIYYQRGEIPGFAWGDENSGWMYLWAGAMFLSPWASCASLAVVGACVRLPERCASTFHLALYAV